MKLFATALLMVLSIASFAQHHESFIMPEFTMGIGASYQKFGGLDSRIAGFPQYKELNHFTGNIQLGAIKERNQWISELNLMAGNSFSGDNHKRSSSLKFYSVGVGVGYDVIKEDRIALFPLIGLGFQGYKAVFNQDVTAVPFNTILNTPGTQSQIDPVDVRNIFFNYRTGLGFTIKSPRDRSASIGLLAIYTGSFSSHDWKSRSGQSLSGSPSDRVDQFQLSLIMGHQPRMMK